jgi:hypothetical protein
MAKLKLAPIEDNKPVRVTLELSAQVHRDLIAYGELLGAQAGHAAIEPAKLMAPCCCALWPPIACSSKHAGPCGAPVVRARETRG